MRRILGIVVAISIMTGAGVALAEDDAPRCWEARRGEIRCEDWDIDGRTHTPRAFVLLDRSRERYEAPPLERDLANEIRRSVRRAPF